MNEPPDVIHAYPGSLIYTDQPNQHTIKYIKATASDEVLREAGLMRLPVSGKFGCYCDLELEMEPDGCVIDEGNYEQCTHAHSGIAKEDCRYWREIK